MNDNDLNTMRTPPTFSPRRRTLVTREHFVWSASESVWILQSRTYEDTREDR